MINPFKLKKNIAIMIVGAMPALLMYLGLLFISLWVGVGLFALGMIVAFFVGNLLLKTPFSDMLEGRGLLVFDINSSGMINPFIVNFSQPFLKGKYRGKTIKDVFDRQTVVSLAQSIEEGKAVEKDGKIYMVMDREAFAKSRFAMNQYPVLLYNSNIHSFLTKDYFSDEEKISFIEHITLNLQKSIEESSMLMRDFARYVVETLRPQKESLFKNKWIWLVIIIFVVVILVLFGIPLISNLSSAVGGGLSLPNKAVIPI